MARTKVSVFTLSDGVKVRTSSVRSSRTGYHGSSWSVAWTLKNDKPFIAAVSKPSDSKVLGLLTAPDCTNIHLGHYHDAREAAYVSAKFEKAVSDKDYSTVRDLINYGVDSFPSDLYAIPPALVSAQDVAEHIANHRANKGSDKSKSKIVAKDRSILATETSALTNNFGRPAVVALAQKLGGAEFLQSAIKGKTIQQVADEYELAMI